jgi:hypothetical protein
MKEDTMSGQTTDMVVDGRGSNAKISCDLSVCHAADDLEEDLFAPMPCFLCQ